MTRHVTLPKTPSFSLEGRRALVTGAGRGIGLAAAAALAEAGAHVTLMSRTASEIDGAAAEIRKHGGQAEALVLDVTKVEALHAAIDTRPAFDVFVNNAGGARHAPFLEVKLDDYDAVMDLNVRAAFFAMQAVARGMVAAGKKGSIVNVSSQMGHVGGPKRSVYCATKFALEGLTKSAALDLAPHGIRVNTICPTFIETPMTRPGLADAKNREWIMSKIKLGRVGQVEDLMGAIVFLASDASALMTGSSLMVDGGWTAD